jgi:hypothetical protein
MKWMVFCAIVLIATSSSVLGGLTTYQAWTFDDADNPAFAEVDNNPYGDPTAAITVTGEACGSAPGWYSTFLGRQGVWAAELTTATLVIPNNPVLGGYKEIWLEMGFRTEIVETTVLVANIPNLVVETLQYEVTLTRDQYGYLDGWSKLLVHWRIYPNPLEEIIFLSVKDSGADIDYITVYTECVPEPASLCLLGAGAALALFRKRN